METIVAAKGGVLKRGLALDNGFRRYPGFVPGDGEGILREIERGREDSRTLGVEIGKFEGRTL